VAREDALTQSGWRRPCAGCVDTHQNGTGEQVTMRTPSRPFFKAYELVAIAVFIVAGVVVCRIGLVY